MTLPEKQRPFLWFSLTIEYFSSKMTQVTLIQNLLSRTVQMAPANHRFPELVRSLKVFDKQQ